MNNWYYSLDGQNRIGPIPENELKKLITQGNLNGQTFVWQEGMAEWTSALNIDRLFSENSPPPSIDSSTPLPINKLKPVETPSYNSATIPSEIKGWNWGAFLITPFWCIRNKLWIGLLSYLPAVGIFVSFYFGKTGNELAWQNRRWHSIQEFKSEQRNWTIAGLIILPLQILLLILAGSGY